MTDPDGTRTVYFPDGEWVDWWTGEVRPGRRYAPVTQPLDRVPLFVRRGAVIPLAGVRDTVGDEPFADITLLCCDVTGSARTVIRDVDGDTSVTVLRDGDHLRITVDGPADVRHAEALHSRDPLRITITRS
jgi:alpha-D-xyloside xylohydrolase